MCSLTILEAISLKSRCLQGHVLKALGEDPSLPHSYHLPFNLWHPLAYNCINPNSASLHMSFFPVYLCFKFPWSYKDISHWTRASPKQVWSHLNLIMCAKTLFPNKVMFWCFRWIWILKGHYSTLCRWNVDPASLAVSLIEDAPFSLWVTCMVPSFQRRLVTSSFLLVYFSEGQSVYHIALLYIYTTSDTWNIKLHVPIKI